MASNADFVWKQNPSKMAIDVDRWDAATQNAVEELFKTYAPRFEAQMKQNAPWRDMTGTARSALAARVERDGDKLTMFLGFLLFEAEYFVFLEFGTKNWQPSDKYSIVQPTMEVAVKILGDGVKGILA